MRGRGPIALAGLLALATSRAAAAPQTSPIVDRHFDVDLYGGGAVGSPRMVAMGGTNTAVAEGAAGLLGNPGAAAVRPLASPGRWDWDLVLGAFAPELGTDFDNNGRRSEDGVSARLTAIGLLGFYGPWAFGLGVQAVSFDLAAASSEAPPLTLETTVGKLALARTFLGGALAAGLGLRWGALSLAEGTAELFSLDGGTLEAGVLVSPPGRRWRAGARASSYVRGRPQTGDCDPSDCRGRMLPEGVVAPWEVGVGAAYRLGPSPWNEVPLGRFRDERSLVLAADLVLVGRTGRGNSAESFAAGELQASGRALTLSPRFGLDGEVIPGRWRLRGGSYWEPARVAGVDGRLHLTAGTEVRLISFHFWDAERRLAFSVASDLARHYWNLGLSLGLWH